MSPQQQRKLFTPFTQVRAALKAGVRCLRLRVQIDHLLFDVDYSFRLVRYKKGKVPGSACPYPRS